MAGHLPSDACAMVQTAAEEAVIVQYQNGCILQGKSSLTEKLKGSKRLTLPVSRSFGDPLVALWTSDNLIICKSEGRCSYLQHNYDFAIFPPANCGAGCTEERLRFHSIGVVYEAAKLWAMQCGEQGQNTVTPFIYLSVLRRSTVVHGLIAASFNNSFTCRMCHSRPNFRESRKFFATQNTHTKTAGVARPKNPKPMIG